MIAIATPRLYLSRHEPWDADALVRGLNNFNVSKWLARVPFPYGLADARDFLALCRENDDRDQRLAITRDGQLIGGISVEHGELGYWLAEDQWGKGYGTEAARAVTDHAFEAMGLEAITASYHIGNDASQKVLLGLGFVECRKDTSFSKATGGETRVMRLELTPHAWAAAKERRR